MYVLFRPNVVHHYDFSLLLLQVLLLITSTGLGFSALGLTLNNKRLTLLAHALRNEIRARAVSHANLLTCRIFCPLARAGRLLRRAVHSRHLGGSGGRARDGEAGDLAKADLRP